MELLIKENLSELSLLLSKNMIEFIKNKPDSLICIAGGHSTLDLCQYLVQAEKNKEVDFSQCNFVSLDEWIGLDISTKGSCIETLYNHLFKHISTPSNQIKFFNGKADDLEKECKDIDDFIFQRGSIDLIVLGIGLNGHIGFNEPNIDSDCYSFIADLDEVTKKVSAKYFNPPIAVQKGITLGMKHILHSNHILLIANGIKKAEIVQQTIENDISPSIPATLLKQAAFLSIYLDKEAASKLK